jgi:mono/diheme cytochrome c family protein
MFSAHCSGRLRAASAAVIAVVLMHGGMGYAEELRVCIDKTSPSAALDRRIVDLVGKAQGTPVHIHAYDGTGGERGYRLRSYKDLTAEDCELVVGFPYDAAAGLLPDGILATKPYASTGFVLVTRKQDQLGTLAGLPRQSKVAVTYNTMPNLYFDRHPDLLRAIYETDAESIAAIASHAVAAAMLWRPAVVRELESKHRLGAFTWTELDEPGAHWNIVALYAEPATPIARRFEATIEQLRGNGTLAKALGAYADVTGSNEAPRPAQRPLVSRQRIQRAAPACAKKEKAPPALFTEDQASAGKALYLDKCALCHAPDMNGRAAPALKGKFFAAPSHKYKVSDIFTIVSQNMPATQPGSLAHDDYVKIMAYILQQNGYPSGAGELTFGGATTSKTPLRYYGE